MHHESLPLGDTWRRAEQSANTAVLSGVLTAAIISRATVMFIPHFHVGCNYPGILGAVSYSVFSTLISLM